MLPPEHLCAKRLDHSATWGVLRQLPKNRVLKEKREAPINLPKERLTPEYNIAQSRSIPYRYASLSDCQGATNNCTRHGHCKVMYSEVVNGRQYDYFGCVCDISVVDERNKDGSVRKTTRFGGAACQKVDISVPFWLLTSVTIFMILVVYLGIGMLLSMGNEELPSVIGAGVTGPRAK
jgi:hypothetical protein